jgi:hypothetical protein
MVLVWKTKEIDHLLHPGVEWSILYYDLSNESGMEVMNLCDLAQDTDGWRALANAAINLGSMKCGEFLDILKTG